MRFLLSIIVLLAMTAVARAACDVPEPQPSASTIRFFLGIEPSDGPLDVWCRLQSLEGGYRINVLFPREGVEAHSSFDTVFDGTPSRDRMELASFIQSLLPTTRDPSRDESGAYFDPVLENSVQAAARNTPTGDPLGIPASYPFARELMLWEPMTLRVRPITIAGVEFVLTVRFRPSLGKFLLAMNGQAEDFVVRGWHQDVLRRGGIGRQTCPDTVPICEDLGELIDVHTIWVVENVVLEAHGSGLSSAALSILGQIASENAAILRRDPLRDFAPTRGQASFDVQDEIREILARADGDSGNAAGTQAIRIMWRERLNSKFSYWAALEDYALRSREAMVMANPIQ